MLERVYPLRCSMQRKSSRSGTWPPLLQQLSKESEGCQYLINWDCRCAFNYGLHTLLQDAQQTRNYRKHISTKLLHSLFVIAPQKNKRHDVAREKNSKTSMLSYRHMHTVHTMANSTVRNHSKYKIRETQLIIADMVSSQESNQAMRIIIRTTAWTQLCSFPFVMFDMIHGI